MSTAQEPASQNRVIVFQVTGDGNLVAMCSVLTVIQRVNDHPPIADLNGAAPGTNYTITVPFNPLAPSVPVAASDATITDQDENSKVVTLDFVLIAGQSGDKLTTDLCSPNGYNSSCFLR